MPKECQSLTQLATRYQFRPALKYENRLLGEDESPQNVDFSRLSESRCYKFWHDLLPLVHNIIRHSTSAVVVYRESLKHMA